MDFRLFHDVAGAGVRHAAAPLAASDAVLVDVRTEGEFHSGHIEGALSLLPDRLHVDIVHAVPDRATPLVRYCRSGARCGCARVVLSQMGYQHIANGGGMGGLTLSSGRRNSTRAS